MIYCFDIDGTICTNTDGDYLNAIPYPNIIKKVNELYNEGIKNGAIGGKIIGSGGGGFLLFCCTKKNQKKFFKGFNKLPIIKFNFTETGSQIISKNV